MMNADRAAAYLDISKTKFLEGVEKGVCPVFKLVPHRSNMPFGQCPQIASTAAGPEPIEMPVINFLGRAS